MKFEDLMWQVEACRKKFNTRRNINVSVDHDVIRDLNLIDGGYLTKYNCTIYGYFAYLGRNHCVISTDCGGGFFEVLTENERIIKKLLE